jgi:pimeloyl-ACP methyl ester carboxylesterase
MRSSAPERCGHMVPMDANKEWESEVAARGAEPPEFRHARVPVGEHELHVVECGAPAARPVLFLHGWPENWTVWRQVMGFAGAAARAIAIDLPGVGGPTGSAGTKREIAAVVDGLIERLRLRDLTIVGHDCGGMVAYAYLREHERGERVVVMNTVVPGVAPWDDVVRNPHIWHFGLHAVPDLPEHLVQGRQAGYFDYFYDHRRLRAWLPGGGCQVGGPRDRRGCRALRAPGGTGAHLAAHRRLRRSVTSATTAALRPGVTF